MGSVYSRQNKLRGGHEFKSFSFSFLQVGRTLTGSGTEYITSSKAHNKRRICKKTEVNKWIEVKS